MSGTDPDAARRDAELHRLADLAVAVVRGDADPEGVEPGQARRVHTVIDAIRAARATAGDER